MTKKKKEERPRMETSSSAKKTSRKRYRQPNEDRSSNSGSRSRSSKKNRKSHKQHASKKSFLSSPDDDHPSSSLFSLTPNAIQFMTMGINQFDRKDEEESEKTSKKMMIKKTKADESGSSTTTNSRQNELISRLRIDLYPHIPEPSAVVGDQGPVKSSDSENNGEQAALFGTLGDGKSSIRVMILNPDGIWSTRLKRDQTAAAIEHKDTPRNIDWIIKVHGYASTEKFWHVKYEIFPIICLTSISILHTCHPKKSSTTKPSSPLGQPLFLNSGVSSSNIDGILSAGKICKAQAGTIGTFLKERGPFLTNEELAGSSRIRDPKIDPTTVAISNDETNDELISSLPSLVDQNLKKVHNCLSRHSAMLTLQQSSLSSPSSHSVSTKATTVGQSSSLSSSTGDTAACEDSPDPSIPTTSPTTNERPTQHAWELYDGTLREFRTSQMDRQKASLGTNAGRESAERADLVVKQHNVALELALKEERPLSVELLVSATREVLGRKINAHCIHFWNSELLY